MIIVPGKCAYRIYVEYLVWMDSVPPEYMRDNGKNCEDCPGADTRKPCFVTLERLLELNESTIDDFK